MPTKTLLALITIILYLAFSPPAKANEINPETLSLSKVIELVERYNPQLAVMAKDLESSQSDIDIAKQRLNPSLDINYGFGSTTVTLGNPQQIGLSQTLQTAGKRKKRILVATAQYQATTQQLEAMKWTVRGQARQTYVDLISAQATLKAIEDQSILLQRLVDISEKRVKAGAASEVELLQATLSKKQVDSLTYQVKTQFDQAKVHLNALLGNHLPQNFTVSYHSFFQPSSGDVELFPTLYKPLPPIDILIDEALQNRFDIKALFAQQKAAQRQIELAKAQKVPDLQINAGVAYFNAPARYSPTGQKELFVGAYAGATMELPVINQYKAQVTKAQIALEQTGLQIEALKIQVQDEISSSLIDLENAKESLKNYKSQLLPAASEVVILAQKSYQYGKSDLTSVIVAQQSERQAQQGYLEEIARYQRAWANLEKACGKELPL